jgi:hypothetical protein
LTAGTTLGFVNTDNLTAPMASPSLVFSFDERFDTSFADADKILDHAHAVFSLVPGV